MKSIPTKINYNQRFDCSKKKEGNAYEIAKSSIEHLRKKQSMHLSESVPAKVRMSYLEKVFSSFCFEI